MDIQSTTQAPAMEEFDIYSDWYTNARSFPISSPFEVDLPVAGPFVFDSGSETDFSETFPGTEEASDLGGSTGSVEIVSEIEPDIPESVSESAASSTAVEVQCSGLRVVGIDSDTDSEYLEPEDPNSFDADSPTNGVEEFELGEDDRDHTVEEVTVSSDNFSDEGEDPALRNFEWEFLLEIINSRRDLVMDFDPYMTGQDDYVSAVESDAILEQLVDGTTIKGSPPAAKRFVENLPLLAITEEDLEMSGGVCSVCKDEVSVGDIVKMLPCLHYYHGDCILPWLEIRNSCPVCRHELPTDDLDYERSKVQRAGSGSVPWDPQIRKPSVMSVPESSYAAKHMDKTEYAYGISSEDKRWSQN